MLTALLLFWPALAGLLVLLIKGEAAKKVAFGAAVIEFLIAVYAAIQFEPNAATQFEINLPWIQNAGINFHIGMDGISLLLVLLTAFLVPLIILSTFKHEYRNAGTFYALILFMQTGMIGSFVGLGCVCVLFLLGSCFNSDLLYLRYLGWRTPRAGYF